MESIMDKTRLLGVGTLAVLLVAVSGNTVLLGQAGNISACFHSITGALRVVATGTQCLPTESPIVWSVQGVPGPQGPQGPQGPAGSTNVLTSKLIHDSTGSSRSEILQIPGFGAVSLNCTSIGHAGLSVISPGAYQLSRINVDNVTLFTIVVNAGSGFTPLTHDPPDSAGRSIDTVWITGGISALSPIWKLEYHALWKDFANPCVVAVAVTTI
jgi:hypothetical protein